jgi:hypothetical protein
MGDGSSPRDPAAWSGWQTASARTSNRRPYATWGPIFLVLIPPVFAQKLGGSKTRGDFGDAGLIGDPVTGALRRTWA